MLHDREGQDLRRQGRKETGRLIPACLSLVTRNAVESVGKPQRRVPV